MLIWASSEIFKPDVLNVIQVFSTEEICSVWSSLKMKTVFPVTLKVHSEIQKKSIVYEIFVQTFQQTVLYALANQLIAWH